QITEMPPLVTDRRPDCPEDLALAVMRCLEKDPENRWPSADALRRALEARSVTGYRPTGMTRAGKAAPPASPRRSSALGEPPPLSPRPLANRPPRPSLERSEDWRNRLDRHMDRASRRMERGGKGDNTPLPVPDTGEPMIVQKTRAQFARWAAVTGGLFMINLATDITTPWFLFPMAGMGFGLVNSYAKLWQAGYSWRDVLNRPVAPDAVQVPGSKGGKPLRQLAAPRVDEYGRQYPAMKQAHDDRSAILKLLERMSPAERKMLPEDVGATVDGLYNRASDLARTLQAMDGDFEGQSAERIQQRIAALQREPDDEERSRRLTMLEKQLKTIEDLKGKRDQIASQLESCTLAMQNVRFDLLRLRSADAASALGDLTMATQQARALSRDVDNAIVAASEIREALGRD
ncbi:MAG TPA: 2TM domain-containing protein, partial [Gemmatimonadales bacterium]|nr:2TM domain-containing protein [Gemmatimonadales bacterium]